jgi:hypothetical protein
MEEDRKAMKGKTAATLKREYLSLSISKNNGQKARG